MEEKATLRVSRRANLLWAIRPFVVYVDEKQIASVNNGAQQEFSLPPGVHTVQVHSAGWSKTQKIELTLSPGETRTLECGVNTNFFAPVLVLILFLAMVPHSLTERPEVKGIYAVVAGAAIIFAVVRIILSFKPGRAYYLKETTGLGKNTAG